MQKSQLIDLQEHFERYCNTKPVVGFNNARCGIKFIKRYLLPIIVNERDIEPIVAKKASHFVLFKFGYVQLLDILKFPSFATNLGSFLKAYKQSEINGIFPHECYYHRDKMNSEEQPPYEAFHNKQKNCNPLQKEYVD